MAELTKADKYDALPSLRQNLTLAEIAKLWGESKMMVSKRCRDLGLSIKHSRWRNRNKYQVNL